MALVLEMERCARPGATGPFDPVRMEFDAVRERAVRDPDPEILIRADLARAGSLLVRGNLAGAGSLARSAAEQAGERKLPGYRARAFALLAAVRRSQGDMEKAKAASQEGLRFLEEAAGRIQDPKVREDYRNQPCFQDLLLSPGRSVQGAAETKLKVLYEMIRSMNSADDPEELLQTILDMALQAVQAERGMILLRDEKHRSEFTVRLARNLEKETEADVESYSRGIVTAAGAGRSVIALDAGNDRRFQDLKSVSLFGIRSLMCVPLRSRGRIIGTVYLDSRKDGALFTEDDLRFVEAFADHAALAFENTRARHLLETENRRLHAIVGERTRLDNIIGRSPAMRKVFDRIETFAGSDLPVLILGESGTGKELTAKAIHFHGSRRRKIFLTENCAAIPETLLESELFGHVRGAFTGADRDRPGLFEQADGGTLFLDEVGDMPPSMQVKLLRVLQEGEIRRVGGEKTTAVDVRLVAATNKNLRKEVDAGHFREDLFYRLNVLTLGMPALRDRPEDIPLLIDHFLEEIARERGRKEIKMESQVLRLLELYRWPGNIRELENCLHRLALSAGDGPITLDLVRRDDELRRLLSEQERSEDSGAYSLEEGEKLQILRALEASRGNRAAAARLLGISRATIYRKIKLHRL